jgi:pimeloyl-ACP methyl ester carboxylesterase
MTTVLLCYPPGQSGGGMYLGWCKGWANTRGQLVDVPYTASLDANSITDGVTALDAALKNTPGDVVVMGHSQGAQVISRWLREHADDPDAPDPSRVSFLLTGNPLRPGTGRIVGGVEVGGTTGQPTREDTRYQVTDVARQHDGWAIKGPLWGRNGWWGMFVDHMRYNNVDLNNAISRTVVGNTIYLTVG